MSDCPTCLPGDCGLTSDLDLYNLSGPLFPFILNCPPGFNCNAARFLRLACGDSFVLITIPVGATAAQRLALITAALSQCARNRTFDDNPEVPPFVIDPDGETVQFYFNRAWSCTEYCSVAVTVVNGVPVVTKTEPFEYTLLAGSVIGFTQLQANSLAKTLSCQLAKEHIFCLSNITKAFCLGEGFTATIKARGRYISKFPHTDFWELTSGTLPPGLTFHGGNITGGNAVIDGTPTTAGLYTFTIAVTLGSGEGQGDQMSKTYTMAIVEIDNDEPLPDLDIGVPYLENLTVSPTHDQETEVWSVVDGTLPAGLELTPAGILTGTPTEDGDFPFTASVTFTVNNTEITCEKELGWSACPIPADYSYNCPLNAVPKTYVPWNPYFVAYNSGLSRVMLPEDQGRVELVDYTPGVPVLDFAFALGTTQANARAIAGIYDADNTTMVFAHWNDILGGQPLISFVDNTGVTLNMETLSGFTAGLKNNPHFCQITRGNKYVVLFLASFDVTNKSSLLLLDADTNTIVLERDFTPGSIYEASCVTYSCVQDELILTYRQAGTAFLHKIKATDLTDVSTVNLGTDAINFATYDPSVDKIIVQVDDGVSLKLKWLNPITGAVENTVDTGYTGAISWPGIYVTKLLSYVFAKMDDGVVSYYDSLTPAEKCNVSFAGLVNPTQVGYNADNGYVYVQDDGGGGNVWELTPT